MAPENGMPKYGFQIKTIASLHLLQMKTGWKGMEEEAISRFPTKMSGLSLRMARRPCKAF
jgi:hypothetical protein